MSDLSTTRRRAIAALVPAGALALFATLLLWLPASLAAEAEVAIGASPEVLSWGFAAAAAATGLSSLAAAYAVAAIGSAGVGAMAEKPELMGRVLVLVGLAEGIAIYGLIVAVILIGKA